MDARSVDPYPRAMAPRPKSPPDPEALDRAVAQVVAQARSDGSVMRSRLPKLGIPKAALSAALTRFEASGLEITSKCVRVPLTEQLASRLRDGAVLPLKTLRLAVSGATAAEAAKAAAALGRAGLAQLVVRGRAASWMGPRADLLAELELEALDRAVTDIAQSMKAARKHRGTLLEADVRAAFAPFTAGRAPRLEPSDVLAAARSHCLGTGLVFVPALVRALGGPSARLAVHEALLDAARRGLLELRPESGLARLSDEDLALCLPGPQGSRLSWARPIEPAP
jgi:hypothetical protein